MEKITVILNYCVQMISAFNKSLTQFAQNVQKIQIQSMDNKNLI